MEALKLRQLIACLVVASGICLTGTTLYAAQRGVFFPFQWTADFQEVHYGITMDAGSHGTRAHLFAWSGRVEDPVNPLESPATIPEILLSYTHPDAVGISSFVGNPADVGPVALRPLIRGLKEKLKSLNVPKDAWADIPLFLKATAGMRNTNVVSRDSVMRCVRQWLGQSTNNPFKFKNEWARVISGEEEGTFGWLSVNTATGTLFNPANSTVGSLDLGGSSSQITFMPMHTSVLEGFYELTLGHTVIRLYSHSFLGYGWEDAKSRVATKLALESLFHKLRRDLNVVRKSLEDSDIAGEVLSGSVPGVVVVGKSTSHYQNNVPTAALHAKHPCYPRGYEFSTTIPSLVYPDGRAFLDMDVRAVLGYIDAMGIDLDSPAITRHFPKDFVDYVKSRPLSPNALVPVMNKQIETVEQMLIEGRLAENATEFAAHRREYPEPFSPFVEPLPSPKLHYIINFSGTGDFYQCQARAKELFYREPCFLSTCSFNGVYQPRIAESRFLALGQFAKLRSALALSADVTPNTLERAAAGLCSTDWSTIRLNRKNGQYRPFGKRGIVELCWKAVWAHATLAFGYGFEGESLAVILASSDSPDSASPRTVTPGWALGSMITEISYFPWDNTRGRFREPFWWALASCVSLTALALAQKLRLQRLNNKLSLCDARRSDMYHEEIDA